MEPLERVEERIEQTLHIEFDDAFLGKDGEQEAGRVRAHTEKKAHEFVQPVIKSKYGGEAMVQGRKIPNPGRVDGSGGHNV